MLRIFEDQKVSDFLRSVAATALNPKSFLPRDRLTHVNYAVRRTVRAAASAPRRPAIRTAHSRGLRRLRPEICAENLKKSPENTKITKKKHANCCMIQLFVLLLGQAIRRNAT